MLLGAVSQAGSFRVVAVDVLAYSGVLPVTWRCPRGETFQGGGCNWNGWSVTASVHHYFADFVFEGFIGLVYVWVLSILLWALVYGVYAVRMLGRPKNFSG